MVRMQRLAASLVAATMALGLLAPMATESAMATSNNAYTLNVGDAVTVAGTHIACLAFNVKGVVAVGCILKKRRSAIAGSYTAGIFASGTVYVSRIKADGSSVTVIREAALTSNKSYVAHVGDVFGFRISSKISLGCQVINIASTSVAAIYRGVKVSCWRATTSSPLARSWGLSLSDKLALVFKFDSNGNVTNTGNFERQPAL